MDTFTKLCFIKPIWGDETQEKNTQALKEFLDSPFGKHVKVVNTVNTDNGNFGGPFHNLLVERGIHHQVLFRLYTSIAGYI